MVENYLIISKQEFVSLYRFGCIPLYLEKAISHTNDIDALNSEILRKLKQLPPFEGDEEYLVVGFSSITKNSEILNIYDIQLIIPLTEAAKASYESKFDSRIKFTDAIFEEAAIKHQAYTDIQDRKKGVEAIFKMLLPQVSPPKKRLADIELAYNTKIEGKRSNEFSGDFFTHILVYDRYEPFPNTDLGYFYDIGEVLAHSQNKPTFKGSGYHTYLESKKSELRNQKLSDILKIINQSDESSAFKKKLTSENTQHDVSALLYLKFKDQLIDKESITETKIKESVEFSLNKLNYNNEVVEALYLLGSFFGFKKFYSDYYEVIDLNIFRPHKFHSVNTMEEGIESDNSTFSEENEESDSDLNHNENFQNEKHSHTIKNDVFNVDINQTSEEERVLNELALFLGDREVKVSGDDRKTIASILAPLTSDKVTVKKIMELVSKFYPNKIEIPKKDTLKVKFDQDLFANAK